MTRRIPTVLATLVLAGGTAVGLGCGKDGDDESASQGARTETGPTATSRADVLKNLDGPSTSETARGFDPGGIYARESLGVVTVIATGLSGSAGRGGSGLGSGFVVSDTGEIATNAHVVTSGEGSSIKKAGSVFVRFKDGNQVSADIVGFDPFSDVALLKLKDLDGIQLRPLPLGKSDDVVVGEPVAAIGSPFGEEQSLSVGVISATERSIDSLTGFQTSGAIQTDAAINQGNSGGPLLNAAGEVLGINSQIRTESGDGSGVGFAVPVDTVSRSLEQLRTTGKVSYSYLGVASSAVYPQLAEEFDLPVAKGAWIQEVTDGGPADDAGLKEGSGEKIFQARPYAPGGDLIVAVDGKPVERETDLGLLLLERKPGETVTLTLYRGKEKLDVEVELEDRPTAAPARRG